jgi:hypothetical protein
MHTVVLDWLQEQPASCDKQGILVMSVANIQGASKGEHTPP